MDYGLHDWTFHTLDLDWSEGRVLIKLREFRTLDYWHLVAKGVKELRIPRRLEWGHSKAINGSDGPRPLESGDVVMSMEIQSGDLLEIEAETIELKRIEDEASESAGD